MSMKKMEKDIAKDKKVLACKEEMVKILKPFSREKQKRIIKAVMALNGMI